MVVDGQGSAKTLPVGADGVVTVGRTTVVDLNAYAPPAPASVPQGETVAGWFHGTRFLAQGADPAVAELLHQHVGAMAIDVPLAGLVGSGVLGAGSRYDDPVLRAATAARLGAGDDVVEGVAVTTAPGLIGDATIARARACLFAPETADARIAELAGEAGEAVARAIRIFAVAGQTVRLPLPPELSIRDAFADDTPAGAAVRAAFAAELARREPVAGAAA
jgi:hypothetical protein